MRLNAYPIINRLVFDWNDIRYGRNLQVLNKTYIINEGKILIGDDFNFSSGEAINPISRNIRGTIYCEMGGEFQ